MVFLINHTCHNDATFIRCTCCEHCLIEIVEGMDSNVRESKNGIEVQEKVPTISESCGSFVDLSDSTNPESLNFSHELASLKDNEEASPKRKRGRPKRSEARRSDPVEPRTNPDRAARHQKRETGEFADDDDLLLLTNNADIDCSSKRNRKKKPTNRNLNGPPRPRGRPRKVVKKLICIVKPMPQSGNENKPRKCGWAGCAHMANSVRALKSHVEREHMNHLSRFVCRWDGCSRSNPFKALYMLSLHLRSHIGERPYECRICGKTYTRQENLRTHQRTHSGERPFKCTICQKGFISASDKAKHQNRTHNHSKSYECPVECCSKKYTDPSSLRKHIIKSHGNDAYKQAKQNKQRNGPGNNYGVIPNNLFTPPVNSNLVVHSSSSSRNTVARIFSTSLLEISRQV